MSAHSCRVWQTLAPPRRDPVRSSRLQTTWVESVCEAGGGMAEGGGGAAWEVADVSSVAKAWPAPSSMPAATAAARIRIMVKSPELLANGRMPGYYGAFRDEANPLDEKMTIATL